MSSDGSRRFRKRLASTVGVLAAASIVLAVAGIWQGPKLVEGTVDAERVTRLAGTRLVLQLNQPVSEVGDLRITPSEPADLTVDGDRLVIVFERPLPYDEEILVEVADVVGTALPGAADLAYRFTTADEAVYTLDRRSVNGRADVVRRTTVAGDAPVDVIEAPRLQAFAHAGEAVVAVAIEEDGSNTLRVAGIGDEVQTLGLAEPGVVRDIGGSTTHPLIAYRLTGLPRPDGGVPAIRNALFVLDVSGLAAAPRPVLGANGDPLEVADWRFVPGTTSLVVRTVDDSLFVVDALGLQPPAPLGAHEELRGILPGSTDLIVADPDRGTLLDLTTGKARANDLPPADLPHDAYPGRVLQLDRDGAYLMEVLLVSNREGGHEVHSTIARVAAGRTTLLYATADGSKLLASCLSPNGRLLAVETAQQGGESDGYPNAPSIVDRFTTIIDAETGEVVRTQNGGSTDWCG
ncbi:hypothetical protein ACFVTX_16310 [Agromyces sp. NPDC058136]|uniref:hypothetical protein n=1 Tax=Agromyces sp. NPDC058136 TaxID=3346354 RepID=UPI0036DD29E1